MHEWIDYVRLRNPPDDCFPCEGSEDTVFIKAIRKELVRETSDSLRNALLALLYSPEFRVRAPL